MRIKPFGLLVPIVKGGGGLPLTLEFTVSAMQSITIPHQIGTYDYYINYGDGSPILNVTSYNDPNATHQYTDAGTYSVEIIGICYSIYFNNTGSKLELTKVTSLGSISYEALSFYGCANMTSFESGENCDTENITSLRYMFRDCVNMSICNTLGLNTVNVTTLSGMWQGCSSIIELNLNHFTTSNVIDLSSTFLFCSDLISLSVNTWDASTFKTLESTFYGCGSLTNLDLSNWYTSGALVNMTYTFRNMSLIRSILIDNFDTSNVTSFAYLCYRNYALTTIDLLKINVSAASSMLRAFQQNSSLVIANTSLWTFTQNCDLTSTFYNSPLITSEAEESVFWDNILLTAHSYTFGANTARSNYASIPNDWKGL